MLSELSPPLLSHLLEGMDPSKPFPVHACAATKCSISLASTISLKDDEWQVSSLELTHASSCQT